jgi:hypothetical protein
VAVAGGRRAGDPDRQEADTARPVGGEGTEEAAVVAAVCATTVSAFHCWSATLATAPTSEISARRLSASAKSRISTFPRISTPSKIDSHSFARFVGCGREQYHPDQLPCDCMRVQQHVCEGQAAFSRDFKTRKRREKRSCVRPQERDLKHHHSCAMACQARRRAQDRVRKK